MDYGEGGGMIDVRLWETRKTFFFTIYLEIKCVGNINFIKFFYIFQTQHPCSVWPRHEVNIYIVNFAIVYLTKLQLSLLSIYMFILFQL